MALHKVLNGPIVVSFSGLDGSGKSTQIAALREALTHLGMRSTLVTFWDDVVVATRWREGFVHKVFRSEQGVGAPGRPVERRDKNMKVGYLTLMRHILYLADAVHLRIVLYRARRSRNSVIIMDRSIDDELANLPLGNQFSAAYAKLLAKVASRPQLALLLDADPEAARARKPEYPVQFLRESRRSYYRLANLLGDVTIIPPLSLEDAKGAVLASFLRLLGKHKSETGLAGAAPAA